MLALAAGAKRDAEGWAAARARCMTINKLETLASSCEPV
jgi:hypothetical protein